MFNLVMPAGADVYSFRCRGAGRVDCVGGSPPMISSVPSLRTIFDRISHGSGSPRLATILRSECCVATEDRDTDEAKRWTNVRMVWR